MQEKKCRIYGYEEYKHYLIRLGWLMKDYEEEHPKLNYCYTDTLFKDWPFTGCLIVDGLQVPHINTLCSWRTDSESVKDFLGSTYRVPKDGESLYFMHDCSIPRTKFKSQWKGASKINKAASIVIPDFRKWTVNEGYALFINEATKELWVMDLGYDTVLINMFNKRCGTGDTFAKCVEKLSPKWYNKNCYSDPVKRSNLENAVLMYSGTIYRLSTNQIPLLETLLGKMTNVVFEGDLSELLDGSSSEEFSVDTFENLYTQLSSDNFEIVIPALKCLASLNYNKTYKNAVTLLLDLTVNKWYPYKNVSVAVKQMCRDLRFLGSGKSGGHNYTNVTPDELEIFSTLYKKRMEPDIKSLIDRYQMRTDAKVELEYTIKITL